VRDFFTSGGPVQAVVRVLSGASLIAWLVQVASSEQHHPLNFWLLVFFAGLALSFLLWALTLRTRLRLAEAELAHGPSLADWLGERAEEVEGLQARLGEILAKPRPLDFVQNQNADLIADSFRRIHEEVFHRLQLEAPDQIDGLMAPPWHRPEVTYVADERITRSVRLMAHWRQQVAVLQEKVR
jgi:hypothetical protein